MELSNTKCWVFFILLEEPDPLTDYACNIRDNLEKHCIKIFSVSTFGVSIRGISARTKMKRPAN